MNKPSNMPINKESGVDINSYVVEEIAQLKPEFANDFYYEPDTKMLGNVMIQTGEFDLEEMVKYIFDSFKNPQKSTYHFSLRLKPESRQICLNWAAKMNGRLPFKCNLQMAATAMLMTGSFDISLMVPHIRNAFISSKAPKNALPSQPSQPTFNNKHEGDFDSTRTN